VGYLCANFSLLKAVLELGPMYVTDRQRDVRCQTKASLNASPYGCGGIIITVLLLLETSVDI